MAIRRPETRPKTGLQNALVVHMIKDLNSPPQASAALDRGLTLRTVRSMRSTNSMRSMNSTKGSTAAELAVEPADVEAWLSIQNEAFQGRARPWTRSDFDRELRHRSWFRAEQLWLARPQDHDEPVGTIALELRGEQPVGGRICGRIHWLAVRTAWQRRGIGRMLVTELERACWQRGGRRVALETLGRWNAVLRFYRSLGYHEHDGDSANASGSPECER